MSFILSLTAQQHKELKDVLAHLIDHATVPDYSSTMDEILVKLNKEPKQAKMVIDANQTV
jgi:hypothetical protein